MGDDMLVTSPPTPAGVGHRCITVRATQLSGFRTAVETSLGETSVYCEGICFAAVGGLSGRLGIAV